MKTILPAVLSENLSDYEDAIELFESLPGNNKMHIDIMDGIFVERKSADLENILKINTRLKRQVHLMEEDPTHSLDLCMEYGVEEVIIHFEARGNNFKYLNEYKTNGLKVLLGINPETVVKDNLIIRENFHLFDGILIMTVVPGKQGGAFLLENTEKINVLKSMNYINKTVIDGGVNQNTMDELINFDIDEFVVGSAIIKSENPLSSYIELKSKLPNIF